MPKNNNLIKIKINNELNNQSQCNKAIHGW